MWGGSARSSPRTTCVISCLRDADWAGMAHSLEIRVPLVDVNLLRELAPGMPAVAPGFGKAALARSPSAAFGRTKLCSVAKTGFAVPTANWIARTERELSRKGDGPKGLTSRQWSRMVLAALTSPREVVAT